MLAVSARSMVMANAFVQSGETDRVCGVEQIESGLAWQRRQEHRLIGQQSPSLPPGTAETTHSTIFHIHTLDKKTISLRQQSTHFSHILSGSYKK